MRTGHLLHKPKISIVTAVLNGERFIRRTADSVLSQQGPFELEYIIRDGESTDGTLDILRQLSTDDRVTVISRRDGSPQEAINAGMAQATGDIGAWLNADDVYEPGALAIVAETFAANANRDWLYGRCRIIDENDCEIRKSITLYKNMAGFFYSRNILLCENFINQPATFWRMDLWRNVAALDSRFKAAWDYELWLNMACRSRAIPVRQYLARFRRHSSSISETNFEKQFREELAIANQHAPLPHRLLHRTGIAVRTFLYNHL